MPTTGAIMITKGSSERVMIRWAILGAAVFLIAAVAVSPFALDSFRSGDDTDWQRRSVIGQTYGAISALVAALALGAIAVSVFFQWQEIQATKEFARRAIHNDLLKMAIEDPELRECCHIGSPNAAPSRQHLYCNLLFSFWETNYALGLLHHDEIEGVAGQMLSTRPGYDYWTSTREYRLTYVDSRQEQKFRLAFDKEYHRWSKQMSEASSHPSQTPGGI